MFDLPEQAVRKGWLALRYEQGFSPHRIFCDESLVQLSQTWPFVHIPRGAVHIVEDGDWLRVYHKHNPEMVLWEGVLNIASLKDAVDPMDMVIDGPISHEAGLLRGFREFFSEEYPVDYIPRQTLKGSF